MLKNNNKSSYNIIKPNLIFELKKYSPIHIGVQAQPKPLWTQTCLKTCKNKHNTTQQKKVV